MLLGLAAAVVPFFGIVTSPLGNASRVGCFDPLTLRPLSPPLVIGEYHDAWSRSPDGTRVAFGISAPGQQGRIGVRIVDIASGAVQADVETGIAAPELAWLAPRRIVAALQRGGIVLIDPVTGTVVGRWRGWSGLDGESATARGRFVLLERGRGVRRLAVVDRTGSLRSVALRLPRRGHPALVVDRAGEHAYVVAGGGTVVDVDLRRMTVRRHRLRSPLPRGADYAGAWLGRGRLAVWGRGLSTVDTRSWTVDPIDPTAISAAATPDRLLAAGKRGLRGYTRDGRRVFEVLEGREVWSVGRAGSLAYVVTARATYVVEVRSGRVRRTLARDQELGGVIARPCPTTAATGSGAAGPEASRN